MKPVRVLIVSLLLASATALAQAPQSGNAAPGQGGPAAREAAKPPALPAGVPGVVEFHNLDTVQQHLQAFVASASPGTPPLALISMGLGMMAKTLNPATMDGAQPMRILLVESAEGKLAPVLQFTARDAAAYMSSLRPDLTKVETKDGITSYTQQKQEFDQKAFQQATPEQRKDFQHFMTTTQLPVAIGAADKVICVSDDISAVRAVLALVRSGAIGNAPLVEGGDVAALVEVKALLSGPATGQKSVFDRLKEGMKGMLSMVPVKSGQNPEQLQRILDIEIDALESASRQVDRVSARLDFAAQDARLSFSLAPVHGGKLAAYLASVQPGVPATLSRLPDGAFVVGACKVGNLEPLLDSFTELGTRMCVATGADPATAGALAGQLVEIVRAYGDEFACALYPGQGFRMVETIRLKNPGAFLAAMEKMPDFMALMTKMYRNMGMGMEWRHEKTAYGAHEITRWTLVVDAKPPEGATPEQAAMIAQQQKMMKAMYGDALTMDSSVMEKDFVVAAGKASLETLKQILDDKQNKITDSESFKRVVAALPPQATGFALVHITGLVDWGLSQMRAGMQTTEGVRLTIPEFKFQPGPGATVICLNNPDGSMNCDLRVPAAEIKAVVDGIKSSQGAMNAPPPVPRPQ